MKNKTIPLKRRVFNIESVMRRRTPKRKPRNPYMHDTAYRCCRIMYLTPHPRLFDIVGLLRRNPSLREVATSLLILFFGLGCGYYGTLIGALAGDAISGGIVCAAAGTHVGNCFIGEAVECL